MDKLLLKQKTLNSEIDEIDKKMELINPDESNSASMEWHELYKESIIKEYESSKIDKEIKKLQENKD